MYYFRWLLDLLALEAPFKMSCKMTSTTHADKNSLKIPEVCWHPVSVTVGALFRETSWRSMRRIKCSHVYLNYQFHSIQWKGKCMFTRKHSSASISSIQSSLKPKFKPDYWDDSECRVMLIIHVLYVGERNKAALK